MQRLCALVGDIEKGRGSGTLEVPSPVKLQSRHLSSIFIADVLWLPPHFKGFFQSGGQRSRRSPPHTDAERRKRARTSIGSGMLCWGILAVLVKMTHCPLICKQSVINKGRSETDLGGAFFVPL